MKDLFIMLNSCVDALWDFVVPGSKINESSAKSKWLPVPSELEELIVDIRNKNLALHKNVASDIKINLNIDEKYSYTSVLEILKLLQTNPDILSNVAISIVEKIGPSKSYKFIDSAIINGLLSFISVEEDRCISFIRSITLKASSESNSQPRKLGIESKQFSSSLDQRPSSHAVLIHSLKCFALRPSFVRFLELAWSEPINELRALIKKENESSIQPIYFVSKLLNALLGPENIIDLLIRSNSSLLNYGSNTSTLSIPSSIARICLILESQSIQLFQMMKPAAVFAEEFLFEIYLAPSLKFILQSLSGEISHLLIAKIVDLFVSICKRSTHLSGAYQSKIHYERAYISSAINPLREPFAEDFAHQICNRLGNWIGEIKGTIGARATLQGQNILKARPEEISDLVVLSENDLIFLIDAANEVDSIKSLAKSCIKDIALETVSSENNSKKSIYIHPGVISLTNIQEFDMFWAVGECKEMSLLLGRAQIIQNYFSENSATNPESYRKEIEQLILSLHKYKGEASIIQRYTEEIEKALVQIKLYSKLFHVNFD